MCSAHLPPLHILQITVEFMFQRQSPKKQKGGRQKGKQARLPKAKQRFSAPAPKKKAPPGAHRSRIGLPSGQDDLPPQDGGLRGPEAPGLADAAQGQHLQGGEPVGRGGAFCLSESPRLVCFLLVNQEKECQTTGDGTHPFGETRKMVDPLLGF